MRHLKKVKKLGLPKNHRESLIKNLTTSLVLHGRIRTTEARARSAAARFARMMHLTQKKETRETIRLLRHFCHGEGAARKVITELKGRYEKRSSGFTRITRIGTRKGDNASYVQLELIA